jgi:hypothetical protein
VIYRRQRKQYIFAGFLAVVAVVNVLVGVLLTRPSLTEFATLQGEFGQLH